MSSPPVRTSALFAAQGYALGDTMADSQLGLQFVNVTSNPSIGRNERRIHVRRTVMTEYHKRRRQTKDCEKTTSQSAVQPAYPVHTRSVLLLRPKLWADARCTRTGQLIIRFLCGQVDKATNDLSNVSFIHWQLHDESPGTDQDPLRLCQATLRRYRDTESPFALKEAVLWKDVHVQQERIYVQVRPHLMAETV